MYPPGSFPLLLFKKIQLTLFFSFPFPRLNNIVFHHSSRPDSSVAHCVGIFPDPHTILWVERGQLQQLLLDVFVALGGHMQFNSNIINIQPHIDGTLNVRLSSGSTCNGSYIIGADGVNSRVREYLYTTSPPEKPPSRCPFMDMVPFSYLNSAVSFFRKFAGRPQRESWQVSQTPWTALYGITRPLPGRLLGGDELEGDGVGCMHWYLRDVPGAYSTYSLPGGRVFWICYQQEPRSGDEYFSRRDAEATMNTYSHMPYCSALPIEPGENPAEYELYREERSTYFHDITSRSERIGKVRLTHTIFREISNKEKTIVLIGDAAHAMNTFNGQGAGMGIEEGLVLSMGLLRSAWVTQAFTRPASQDMLGISYFESQRLDRIEKITNLGWWTGVVIMGNWWWLRKLRDMFVARALAQPTPSELRRQEDEGINADRLESNWLFDHTINLESEEEFWESVRIAAENPK